MARGDRALEVRADHGVWAAGWRLALAGVVRAVTPVRRRVLFVSLGVVALGLVVAVVVGLVRGGTTPVLSVVVLVGTAALLAYLVVAVELVLWTMADRRRIAASDVDPERLGRVQQAIAAGHSSSVDPTDRRALVRFARVQQKALPATVLVHVLGVSVGVLLGALEAFAGSAGIVVVVLAVLIVAVSAWSLRGALRALGSTPELVALSETGHDQ
ncbi:hypothetical protein EDF24_0175 [Curtobacterium sp. PhB130]|uniref:hypothetical protein n=1 Tax=unclassified Curtobacterium TaxID=257496 RepID=UPI000F4CEFF5|nr:MULTISPECIES: hypothetical protein [unclassified Curtobacterium]ROS77419.1 hypothetical protein EDF24_0175 [Curtobacterium sp. PhB130]TCK66374.1 hypothetical protein EDF27_1127 [Curtobacterium sp. PhB136]